MTLQFATNKNKEKILDKVQFEAFKTIIRKDLEITLFHHRFVLIIGEFNLFSKSEDELNSFDIVIFLLTGVSVSRLDESFQVKIVSACIDDFLNQIIAKKIILNDQEIEKLAEKYTYYIFESVNKYKNNNSIGKVLDLNTKDFLEVAGH